MKINRSKVGGFCYQLHLWYSGKNTGLACKGSRVRIPPRETFLKISLFFSKLYLPLKTFLKLRNTQFLTDTSLLRCLLLDTAKNRKKYRSYPVKYRSNRYRNNVPCFKITIKPKNELIREFSNFTAVCTEGKMFP